MIPADIRLYTWIDVEEHLFRLKPQWPDWLYSVDAYWDGLTVEIKQGHKENALRWLKENFTPRFNNPDPSIELESLQENRRTLPVRFDEVEKKPSPPIFRPSLSRRSTLDPQLAASQHPTSLAESLPPVVAFHSFKGGVGRTTHALAFALGLTRRRKRAKVLLVDADLEAPGLTWLFRDRFPDPPVSFVDFLALGHGDMDSTYKGSLEIVADRLRNTDLDGLFPLPAFRSPHQFPSLEVRPEHLTRTAKDPFILTEMLARLGAKINADVVIVDLRAGFSETSSGLLLDPRIYRVFLTTVSTQSVQGTCLLLDSLSQISSSSRSDDPLPALVLTQVPDGPGGEEAAERAKRSLMASAEGFFRSATGDENDKEILTDDLCVKTMFDASLAILPEKWQDVHDLIVNSRVPGGLSALYDWLPNANGANKKIHERSTATDLDEERKKLEDFSASLIHAETGDSPNFLATAPLRNLASDFKTRVPIVVMAGAKGAGKTYTFIQAVRRVKWRDFVRDTGILGKAAEFLLHPVLISQNIKDKAQDIIRASSKHIVEELDFGEPMQPTEIRDHLRNQLREKLHAGQWRDCWLDVIAWSVGFQSGQEKAGRELNKALARRKKYLIGFIDGLEDTFQTLPTNNDEQTALRSLLQDVPEWLNQQPVATLGLVVFVRRDMVLSAVKQNYEQLLARYQPYALKWSPEEALRLTAWTCGKAGTLDSNLIEKADYEQLVDELTKIWGHKLGKQRSREARSARWVIAALSDLNKLIQARDVIRFLHEAAKGSRGDAHWEERLLAPRAIRKAVAECSTRKVEEIGHENPQLKELFTELTNLPQEKRKAPFAAKDIELDTEKLKILEDNGVLLREGQSYHMAEIFRHGLGFGLKGRRPRVLQMEQQSKK